MLLSTTKLALLAHAILASDLAVFIKGTFESNSRAYQTAIRNLASLATSEETTLKSLKAGANQMGYFNFRNNSSIFATAVWEAKKRLIGESEEQQITDKEQPVDVASDSSTSNEKEDKESEKPKKTTAKPKKVK